MNLNDEFEHHAATINGLHLHFVTVGHGPAVLLCHGFPDLWYSWRAQLQALARAGYRAIAVDMRGFGESEAPSEITSYTSFDAVGDLVGVLDHLHLRQAAIVGHDWGSTVAQAAVLLRPDRFTRLVTLAVPPTPRSPMSLPTMLRHGAPANFYLLYFLEPGIAERELDADPRTFLRRIMYSNSGDMPADRKPNMTVAASGRLTDSLDEPTSPLSWFTESDLDVYTKAFQRTGFRGALNTYRSLHRSWELMAGWADVKLTVPVLHIGGSRDIVNEFPGMREAVRDLNHFAPRAVPSVMIEGVGHWVQHEAADEVNQLLVDFLNNPDALTAMQN